MKGTGIDNEMLSTILKQEGFERKRVEDLVKKYFEQTDENKRLLVLSEIGVSSAVQEYVDKEVKEAITALVNHQIKKTRDHLKSNVQQVDDIDDELVKFREVRKRNSQNETTEFQVVMQNTHNTTRNSNRSDDDIFDDEVEERPQPKRGRGRGSRGARGGRGNTSSARQNTSTASKRTVRAIRNDDDDDDDYTTKRRKTNNTSRSSSRQTDLNTFFRNNNPIADDVEISDGDDLDVQPKRRRTAAAPSKSTRSRKGVVFDFSD